MIAVACMGGWCRRREACAHYWADAPVAVSERLCAPGEDDPQLLRSAQQRTAAQERQDAEVPA
jgi:hypothetical protein